MKKPDVSKSITPIDKAPKVAPAPVKRVFGSAKGQIVFKKGWDGPLTKRELDQFIDPGNLGPDIRKLKALMEKFHQHE